MWNFAGSPLRVLRCPVVRSEDNEPICLGPLGPNCSYYDHLRERGLVGEAFAARIP